MAPDAGKQPVNHESDPQQSPLQIALLAAAEARQTINRAKQTLVESTLVANHTLRQFLDNLLSQHEDWFIAETAITLDEKSGMLTIKCLPINQNRPNPVEILAACKAAGYETRQSEGAIVFDLTIPISKFEELANRKIDTNEPNQLRAMTGQAAISMAAA